MSHAADFSHAFLEACLVAGKVVAHPNAGTRRKEDPPSVCLGLQHDTVFGTQSRCLRLQSKSGGRACTQLPRLLERQVKAKKLIEHLSKYSLAALSAEIIAGYHPIKKR
jgi:hypothetical protein